MLTMTANHGGTFLVNDRRPAWLPARSRKSPHPLPPNWANLSIQQWGYSVLDSHVLNIYIYVSQVSNPGIEHDGKSKSKQILFS
jgi:hypothetical protein